MRYKSTKYIADVVRKARKRGYYSPSDLARKSGVAYNTITHIERHGRTQTAVLLRVLHALKLDVKIVKKEDGEEA